MPEKPSEPWSSWLILESEGAGPYILGRIMGVVMQYETDDRIFVAEITNRAMTGIAENQNLKEI